METAKLNNEVEMPMLGLGTWDIRGPAGERAILEALELGYRLIDTAQMYENEEIVGRAVRKSGLARREIFITSKLCRPSASYQGAKEGIERSLDALRTDYIDLMLIHEPYEAAPEMYEAFREAYRDKKVRAIGVSNFEPRDYEQFLRVCEVVPAVDQVESHVYYPQLELKELLTRNGTQMQSWASFTEGRMDIFSEPVLKTIGSRHGKTAAQTALRYLVQNGIAVIPKSVHRERMRENMEIWDFALSEDEMREIRVLDTGRSLFGWY